MKTFYESGMSDVGGRLFSVLSPSAIKQEIDSVDLYIRRIDGDVQGHKAKVADVPLVLFSNPAVPARTLGELIAYARANPGKLSYGIPSLGSVNHLLIERLKQITGADITSIPFRGSPQGREDEEVGAASVRSAGLLGLPTVAGQP